MFVGHFGVALAAKKLTPGTSLGTLFLAAQWVDLIWPTFLLLGWEQVRIDPSQRGFSPLVFPHYPFSHSLLAVVGWGALLGGAHFFARRDRRAAFVIAALVVSHWVLDAIVHRPDLPLAPFGQWAIGFGLWNSVAATLVVELGLFAFGVLWYVRAVPRAGGRRWPLWSLVAFLVAVHLASVFGAPPPSVEAIAWVGQSQWLIVLAAYAIDRPVRRMAARAASV